MKRAWCAMLLLTLCDLLGRLLFAPHELPVGIVLSLRETVKGAVPDEKRRAEVFAALFDACGSEGWPLPEARLKKLLNSEEETR